MTDPQHNMRWVARGCALAALVLGWSFIAWQNHFRFTAPMIFVALAYLAVVATIYNLWRTGVAVVDAEDEADSTWAKPAGALGELEREKRTLLKAIKEAEFDHQMGKLSKRDADEMIRVYRARAIEVIKDIDRLGHGAAGSAREQILREVRARLELEARSQKKGPVTKAKVGKARTQPADDASASPSSVEPAAPGTPEGAAAETALAGDAAASAGDVEATDGERPPVTTPVAPAARPAASTRSTLDDDAMDADSTTTVESSRDDRADDRGKEAAP